MPVLWILILIVERYYWIRWDVRYFRFGVPIFSRKIKCADNKPAFLEMQNKISDDENKIIDYNGLKLKKIAEGEFAVRRKWFLIFPSRCRLTFNAENSEFKMQVLVDWFILVLYLYTLISFLGDTWKHPVSNILCIFGGGIAVYLLLIERYLVVLWGKLR
jgi:hypothetical protein